jgi:hypothetical protein
VAQVMMGEMGKTEFATSGGQGLLGIL